ncbi:hypothetical protein NQ318_006549 [Aromia moschata]|uniref:G-patch domain-containing protein n=1 Tax=Aromia moschata TaxID=1265417 RepID=A0AAV8YMC6_9CUCU|nr:hypothetical protein NQ318_006549 [Aromia moschata]
MSKKLSDTFQPKITRNDRFAQMSHQEKVIEQKKREIQAKLEAKEKAAKADSNKSKSEVNKPSNKSPTNSQKDVKNIFSNDGSFLDQFKQMKDTKKFESKVKSFNKLKDLDRNYNEEKSKSSRWMPRRRSPSPKATLKRVSRFSLEKVPNFEPKITINTSFSTSITQNFEPQTICYCGLPAIPYDNVSTVTTVTETVITAPPVLLNVPPPHIAQGQISNALVLTQAAPAQSNVLVAAPLQSQILTTVTLPPPMAPNNLPVSVVSAPTALPVPPPCLPYGRARFYSTAQSYSVQNIPTPNSIQLNEIPNPKPLDLLAIPTPNDDNSISDPDFIKNIPPPNKSVPPPQMAESQALNAMSCLPPNMLPPPQSIAQNVAPAIAVPNTQGVLVHNMPPPAQMQTLQNIQPVTFSSVTVALPVGVVQVSASPTVTNVIPSLMAQPILPPPGMGVNVNMNCPPPVLPMHSSGSILQPPTPSFVSQPPPITSQMPPMNVPPPSSMQMLNNIPQSNMKDMNAGSPDYEAMASLGRMVAECGQGIEDIVRQRKNQDPSLWYAGIYCDIYKSQIKSKSFIVNVPFHKESAAYRQYQGLIQQAKKEIEEEKSRESNEVPTKMQDIYEPEMALEEIERMNNNEEEGKDGVEKKRKRKSRWSDKEASIPPLSVVVFNQPPNIQPPNMVPIMPQISQGPVMLSKITRTDPGLIQYAVNTYGSANLTDEEWKKAEDHYKINLLYQDMMKKREEVERLKQAGKNKYDYDSDEETDGGTWEHKLREKEMMATQLWAQELTRQAEGKHHIGDFLPPEELKRFMEKSTAVKEGRQPNFSDYKEFKIKEDNIGFKMLQKLGWSEGEGLGSSGKGIVEPINKAPPREHTQGLGLNQLEDDEDEYESYRKRMMLAYRFRPNPLNNPRRPYY